MDERGKEPEERPAREIEENARESYRLAVDRAFDMQKGNARLSRRFFEGWVQTLEDQAELNRRTVQELEKIAREQSAFFRSLSRDSLQAYDGFTDSLSSYGEELANERERDED